MTTITLPSGKKILASDPYQPRDALLASFIGRQRELKLITAAWLGSGGMQPLSPLLVGEPGVGKGRVVFHLAQCRRQPLFVFQGTEDVNADDLAASVRFADGGDHGMEYVLAPLATAMLTGGLFFADELGKCRPRALSLLASVLDERGYIDSSLLGERVYAKPGFRFIAATNTGEVNLLPEFIRSRMRPIIQLDNPPKAEISEILTRLMMADPNHPELLSAFWEIWSEAKRPPTPRDAIHHFALASSLSAVEKLTGTPETNRARPEALPIKPEHLREAFAQLFLNAAA